MPNEADELESELTYAESKLHARTVNHMDEVAIASSLKDSIASISKRSPICADEAQQLFASFHNTSSPAYGSVAHALAVECPRHAVGERGSLVAALRVSSEQVNQNEP